MKPVKSLAVILFYLSRIGAVFYISTAVYGILVIGLFLLTKSSWVPFQLDNDRFTIYLPFTRIPFLLGTYTTAFLVVFLTIFSFYGIFLLLLSDVFKAFRGERLFTQLNVVRLTRFYKANIILPLGCLILFLIFQQDLKDAIIISLLHMVLAAFAFFMAAIFKQGFVLQEEQDLTL